MVWRGEEGEETSVVAEEKTTDAGNCSEAENVWIFEEGHLPLWIQIQISRAPRRRLHGDGHLTFTNQPLTPLRFTSSSASSEILLLLLLLLLLRFVFFFFFFCDSSSSSSAIHCFPSSSSFANSHHASWRNHDKITVIFLQTKTK